MLTDRARPLRERLVEFYDQYTNVIMQPEWMRLYLFAGLRGVEITGLYIARVEERIIRPVMLEMAAEHGTVVTPENEARLLELAWSLQGGIFYYGVRKYVYGTAVHQEKRQVIEAAVEIYTSAWPKA